MNVVKWLFGQNCSHRFAWPRNDNTGHHYQICLVCGTAYEYDWMNMRRTRRLVAGERQHHNVSEAAVGMMRSFMETARGSVRDQVSGAQS